MMRQRMAVEQTKISPTIFEYITCRTALLSVPKQQSQESHWKLTYSANAHFFLKLTRKK